MNDEYNVVNDFEQSGGAFESNDNECEYNEAIVQMGGAVDLNTKLDKLEYIDNIVKLSKNIKYLGITKSHLEAAYELNNVNNTEKCFKDTLIMIILENNLKFFKYDENPPSYNNNSYNNNFSKYLILVFAIEFYFQIFLKKYNKDDNTILFHEKAMEQAILMFSFLEEHIFKVNNEKDSMIRSIFKDIKFSKRDNDNFEQLVCYYCIILLQQINIDCLLILPENNTKLLKKIKEITKNYDDTFKCRELGGSITKKLTTLYSNIYDKETKDEIFEQLKDDYETIIKK